MSNEVEREYIISEVTPNTPVWRGEWDEEGVFVYQAYNKEIGEWALEHQKFGGPAWKPARMTWIKPSFAWMLYRSGYGKKGGQEIVLKIKLSHDSISHLLSHCKCVDTNRETRIKKQTHEGGGNGRIQWDPERDLFQSGDRGHVPRKMLRTRAIQIGLAGSLSEFYVNNILSISNVTELAHKVKVAHGLKKAQDTKTAMEYLQPVLPIERPYLPKLSERKLIELAMLPGQAAETVAQLGRGNFSCPVKQNNKNKNTIT
eukprot:CAMPEP_0195510214 /NCGR_PEP_ID=MMETSP0794_2-20130614/2924_1 /TAXON_ID=515487 /ORGANISM="Stephanopyxis turris, Strain CCMP 815" /LENGTH=257 /DNA_ID=CAMNT_0040637591 /DNA_START=43 /DNA_END=816 /DNA_ORIENTATION=+